ncbi:MAG: EscU/YscU/HrcU family type III secretion system export apparatus switch protein [Treponema sp.]|nr:EscU/YscU/HrcU family type III secretion system export apparatus switch protein [Treponema sp.]
MTNKNKLFCWQEGVVISKCDVILKCRDEIFVGISYNKDDMEVPYCICKGDWNYLLTKMAENFGVPCVDNQCLARALYEELKESGRIPERYINAVTTIYPNLNKLKKGSAKSELYEMLSNEALVKVCNLERDVYQRIKKRFIKNQNVCNNLYNGNVTEYFEEELCILVEDNELNYKTFHNAIYDIDEFYLDSYFEKLGHEFLQIVFIYNNQRKIFVASKTFLYAFDFTEADEAICFVKSFVEALKGKLLNDNQKCCTEFEINPKLYGIANNYIKTLVEMNYNQNGFEYGVNFDKTKARIYLKKKEKKIQTGNNLTSKLIQIIDADSYKEKPKGNKMYEILITYHEFLRHPQIFWAFIENPKKFTKWNFYCKIKNYNNTFFDKKFQT